jgi:hypothetical protein
MAGPDMNHALKRADAVARVARAALEAEAAAGAVRHGDGGGARGAPRPPPPPPLIAAAAAADITGEATPDPSPAPLLPLPLLSTLAVHGGAYVDCVRWCGPGAIASKSVQNAILVWSADAPPGAPTEVVRAAIAGHGVPQEIPLSVLKKFGRFELVVMGHRIEQISGSSAVNAMEGSFVGDYAGAAADCEAARRLCPDDARFALKYIGVDCRAIVLCAANEEEPLRVRGLHADADEPLP